MLFRSNIVDQIICLLDILCIINYGIYLGSWHDVTAWRELDTSRNHSTLLVSISRSLFVSTKGLHCSLHLQLFSDFSHIYSLHSALCTLHTPRKSNPLLHCFRSNALIQPVQLTTAPNLLYFAYLCFRFSELSFAPYLSVFSP